MKLNLKFICLLLQSFLLFLVIWNLFLFLVFFCVSNYQSRCNDENAFNCSVCNYWLNNNRWCSTSSQSKSNRNGEKSSMCLQSYMPQPWGLVRYILLWNFFTLHSFQMKINKWMWERERKGERNCNVIDCYM